MSTTTIEGNRPDLQPLRYERQRRGQRSSRRDRRDRGRRQDGVSTVIIEHEGTLNTQAVADAIVEAGFTPAV